jgi:hypothetical protein
MLCLAPAAFATELRGDWESAGDAPMPYEPKYEFEYDCQMELKGKQPFVAVTRFTLRNKEVYFETKKNTRWDWVKLDLHGEPARGSKDPGLQLEGYRVVLRLNRPMEEGGKDRVDLSLGWKLGWKDVEFYGSHYQFEFTREDSRLSGRFYLDVNKPKKTDSLKAVAAQVYCDKVK